MRDDRGFTLIDVIILMIVLAIALPVLVMALGQHAGMGVDFELQTSSAQQAQALMEEIKSKCWDEYQSTASDCSGAGTASAALGPDGTESRTQCTGTSADPFDDVDDYSGYSETCTMNGVQYTRDAEVCYVAQADLETCQGAASDYKRIRVAVTTAGFGTVDAVTVVTRH